MDVKKARLPRVKTSEKNLYRVGDAYYFRLGDYEKSLGTFKNEEAAIAYKKIFEAKRDSIGALAFKFKAKDVWPDYEKERDPNTTTNLKGRKVISQRTFDELKSIWHGHLKKHFANKKLAQIDIPAWNEYVKHSRVVDLTNHRKVLTTFLTWCAIQGYIKTAPPAFPVPKVTRRERRVMKPHEISLMLENSDGPLLLFIALYLFMGVRWGEIIQLRWDAIDLVRGLMQIRDETTRTRKGRAVPVNAFTLKLLVRTRDEQRASGIDTGWVFPKRGAPQEHRYMTSIYKSWERLIDRVEREGLGSLSDITPHDMRATYEYFANKRADFTDTQREKMAGAAIEVQRKHYVKFDAEDVRGLEEVVVFPGLENVIAEKLSIRNDEKLGSGKSRVRQNETENEGGVYED